MLERSEGRPGEEQGFWGLDKETLRSAHSLEIALECMPVGVSWATVDSQKDRIYQLEVW